MTATSPSRLTTGPDPFQRDARAALEQSAAVLPECISYGITQSTAWWPSHSFTRQRGRIWKCPITSASCCSVRMRCMPWFTERAIRGYAHACVCSLASRHSRYYRWLTYGMQGHELLSDARRHAGTRIGIRTRDAGIVAVQGPQGVPLQGCIPTGRLCGRAILYGFWNGTGRRGAVTTPERARRNSSATPQEMLKLPDCDRLRPQFHLVSHGLTRERSIVVPCLSQTGT